MYCLYWLYCSSLRLRAPPVAPTNGQIGFPESQTFKRTGAIDELKRHVVDVWEGPVRRNNRRGLSAHVIGVVPHGRIPQNDIKSITRVALFNNLLAGLRELDFFRGVGDFTDFLSSLRGGSEQGKRFEEIHVLCSVSRAPNRWLRRKVPRSTAYSVPSSRALTVAARGALH